MPAAPEGPMAVSSRPPPSPVDPARPPLVQLDTADEDGQDDHNDEDATKVGPMTKAFVDQLMFKARLAESVPPTAVAASTRPASGNRAGPSVGAPSRTNAEGIPRLADADEPPPEVTAISKLPTPPDAHPSQPPEPEPGPADSPPPACVMDPAPPPVPGPPSPSAPSEPRVSSPPAIPASSSFPPAIRELPSAFGSLPQAPYVEPSLSPRGARWMASSSVYPVAPEPAHRRLPVQALLALGALAVATLLAIWWLFP